MIQKPQLFDDDSAVSPVIGVILMVAITVILAAVIATFVLGLGEQVSDTTPNANFQADFNSSTANYSEGDEVLTITHQTGDALDPGEIRIGGVVNDSLGGLASTWADSDGEIRAGDTLTINAGNFTDFSDDGSDFIDSGDEITIIFDSGDSSSILRTFEAPRNYSG